MSASSNNAPDHLSHLTSLSRAKGFLGREFLTWLWYVAETSSETFTIDDDNFEQVLKFDLWVDDRLVLESSAAQAHENVMKGGDPSQSHEAAAALITGKTVKEMKLGIHIKSIGEFTAVLKSEDLNPRSLKLPNPNQPDQDAATAAELPILMRIKYTQMFLAALDGLFARFLSLRVEDHWEKTSLKSMRDWVKKRSSATTAALH